MENILKRQKFLHARIFGDNLSKQCEIPHDAKNKKIKRIILGDDHSALLFEDGSAVLFGDNSYKHCEIPNDIVNKKIKRIILGGNHSALLFEDGSSVLFGNNL